MLVLRGCRHGHSCTIGRLFEQRCFFNVCGKIFEFEIIADSQVWVRWQKIITPSRRKVLKPRNGLKLFMFVLRDIPLILFHMVYNRFPYHYKYT